MHGCYDEDRVSVGSLLSRKHTSRSDVGAFWIACWVGETDSDGRYQVMGFCQDGRLCDVTLSVREGSRLNPVSVDRREGSAIWSVEVS